MSLFWCAFVASTLNVIYLLTYLLTYLLRNINRWATAAKGLTRGFETLLPKEPLVGQVKVELGRASPWNVTFPSVLWHCWLSDRKGIRPRVFLRDAYMHSASLLWQRVWMSHAGIVSKRLKISSNFFLGLVALPLWFSNTALDNFIHRKQTIEHNTNQIKLNNN